MTGGGFTESSRAAADLNEDISFGALVEERLTPDGEGWYHYSLD